MNINYYLGFSFNSSASGLSNIPLILLLRSIDIESTEYEAWLDLSGVGDGLSQTSSVLTPTPSDPYPTPQRPAWLLVANIYVSEVKNPILRMGWNFLGIMSIQGKCLYHD